MIDKEVTTIKDGKAYYKGANSLNIQEEYAFMVTANGLYDDVNAPVDKTLGRLIGNLNLQSNTWTLEPYSSIGSKDLILKFDYKTVDLSGKPILQFLEPVDYLIISKNFNKLYAINDKTLNFYKTFASATFPAGSSCIQPQNGENNAEYLELYANLNDKDEQNFYKEQWNDYRLSTDAILKNMKDTTAYLKLEDEDEDDEKTGYALYKNQYYGAYFTPKGSELNVNELKKLLDNIYKNQKDTAELLKTALDNTCTYYNPTAAKGIATAIKF